jgi:alanine racemase
MVRSQRRGDKGQCGDIAARFVAGHRTGYRRKKQCLWPRFGCLRRGFFAAGADWRIVNSVGEAIALRALARESPIYICGPVFPDEAPEIGDARASVAIYDSEMALALANAGQGSGQSIGVHIKVETGTNRQGVAPAQALELALYVDRLEGGSG